jgi:ATP-dependent Clp protease adapter protein ClpS
VELTNLGRLWMQNSRQMKFEVFIHNDDVTCFHVVMQGTQKVVVMGRHNFKDEALIKR